MNYQRLYDQLVAKAQLRGNPEGYSERHHIVPRCMGGSDDKSNLVNLTALEHIKAHKYLAHIHGGVLWNAYWFMVHINNVELSEKEAAFLREEFGKAQSESVKLAYQNNEEYRNNRALLWKEYWSNPENRNAQSKRTTDFFAKNPDAIKQMGEKLSKVWNTNPNLKKAQSERSTAYFAIQENRVAQSQRTKNHAEKPEIKKEFTLRMAKLREDNKYVEACLRKQKEAQADPEYRRKMSETKLAQNGIRFEVTFDNGHKKEFFGISKTEKELGCPKLYRVLGGHQKYATCTIGEYAGLKAISVRRI